MVLPLLIVGAVIILGGAYAISKSSNSLENVTSIFQSKPERKFELDEKKQSAIVRDRGVYTNLFAWWFGEQAIAETTNDKAAPQKVLTGLESDKKIDTGSYNSRRTGRSTRFNK